MTTAWTGHPAVRRRAVLLIYDLSAGGAQRVLTWLANSLSERGHDVVVVTLAQQGPSHFPLVDRVQCRDLGERAGGRGGVRDGSRVAACLRRFRAVRQTLREYRPDVAVAFVGTVNLLLILASRGLGCRVVISERNDPSIQQLRWPWNGMRRLCYRLADVVTANTRGAVDHLAATVPAARLRMIPNAIDVGPFEREVAGIGSRIILNVGRLHRQKAQDVLLRALADVPADRRQGWRLQIAGEGALLRELQALTRELGLADAVDWLGRVDDLRPLYRSAGIFVLASRYEGLPNALLEAMASGCACVVSDASPGPLEYVTHDVSGLVVAADNVRALSDALLRLLDDPALRERLGRAAWERVAALDARRIADEWESALWPPDAQVTP